jgi:hypothetical protein
MKKIRIVDIDIYYEEGNSIFDNCIYVGINLSKSRHINDRLLELY